MGGCIRYPVQSPSYSKGLCDAKDLIGVIVGNWFTTFNRARHR